MNVRSATSEDAQEVFALTKDFATSFRPEFDAFATAFELLRNQDDALLLVPDESGRLLGYLLGFDHFALFANGRVSWVEEIMVREDRRRQRVGADLMAHFEPWTESRGSKLVALATRRAAGFYTALGYEDSATYFRKIL
jgi:GNAT superfamily N-acetyltransferase